MEQVFISGMEIKTPIKSWSHKIVVKYSVAKLSSISSPVELSTALILIISTNTPGIVVMRHFQTT